MPNSCFPALTTLFTRRANNCDVENQGLVAGSESSAMCETAGKLARQSKFSIATEFLSNLFKAWKNNTKVYDEVVEKCVENKNFRKVFITKFIQEAEESRIKHLDIKFWSIELLMIHFSARDRYENYLKYPKIYIKNIIEKGKVKEETKEEEIIFKAELIQQFGELRYKEKASEIIDDLKNNTYFKNAIKDNSELKELYANFNNLQSTITTNKCEELALEIIRILEISHTITKNKYAFSLTCEIGHTFPVIIQDKKIISLIDTKVHINNYDKTGSVLSSGLIQKDGFKVYQLPIKAFLDGTEPIGSDYVCQAMTASVLSRLAKLNKAGIQPFIFDDKENWVYPNPIIYSNAQSDRFFNNCVELYNNKVVELNEKNGLAPPNSIIDSKAQSGNLPNDRVKDYNKKVDELNKASETEASETPKYMKLFESKDRKTHKNLPKGRTKDNLFYFLFKNLEGSDLRYMMGKLKRAHPEIMTAVLNDYAQNPGAWEQTTQKPTPPNQKTSNRN